MKLKLKMVALAAALASLAGGAQADLTFGGTTNNGSMALVAFNTVTRDWYIRDLGYFINDFIPTGITTSAGDGSVAGNKTPEAGLTIDGSVKSNFSDASFATWFGQQIATDVRWTVGSYDQVSNATSTSQRRAIIASKNPAENFTNANVDSFISEPQWGGLSNYFNPGILSRTGAGFQASADTGLQGGVTLDTLGTVGTAPTDSMSLFYVVRAAFSGGSANAANATAFGNSGGLAMLTLAANGDLVYSLAAGQVAAPVPLPAAAWLMGAGLLGIGGMVRRRRAAALQA